MLRNNTATFVANRTNGTIEITQLSINTTTQVDALMLLSFLQGSNNSSINKHSKCCPKCGMAINYTTRDFHLQAGSNIIHTYLTKGFDKQLIQYILESFKDIEKASESLLAKEPISDARLKKDLSELTSDDLLVLYKKRIILEAQASNKEFPWAV